MNEEKDGKIINGYDYKNQCWIINGIIQRCGHPEAMDCGCYGKIHEGEEV
jgi:hypothetical protein